MTLAEFDDRARRAYRSFNTFEQLLSDLNACDHGMYWARDKSLGEAWRDCANPSFITWWVSRRLYVEYGGIALHERTWCEAQTELEVLVRGARLTVPASQRNSPDTERRVCDMLRRVYHWSGRKKR